MRPIRFLAAAALTAAGAAALAAGGQDVNLDGSAQPHKKGPLAAAAASQLRQDDAPSPATTPPVGVKAQADADIAARDARAKGPRLKVQRQNLKGQEAAREIAARRTPNTIDHDTAYGDKDHTEQVTDLKISVKK
jgi:hypothetical protein